MSGIVLAGGESARMGQDKARLPYGQTTLLAHVVEVVRPVTGTVVVVAAVANQYDLGPDVRVLGDLFPSVGPLGGIVTGLEVVGDGYHLVVACDMPRLQRRLLRLLLAEAEGYDGAVPEVDGRLEPLCAVYHARCVESLRASLEVGHRAVHKAIETLHMKRVGEDALRRADPDLVSFTNVNAPEDYRVLSDKDEG